MDRIAVIGDYDSIYGFAALGLDIYPATEESVHDTMHKLIAGSYGIVYMTEALADKVPALVEHYKSIMKPAIILIPGTSGNTGRGIKDVKLSVEQAVGSDILFSNND